MNVGELVEPIDRINHLLQREYGVHEDGRPKFRVVWANDQLEKRWVTHTKEGFQLLSPEIVELPKYIGGYYHERYILEQLSIVPVTDREMIANLSYEPLWVFRDRFDNYLPPKFEMCKYLVDHVYNLMGKKQPVKKENPEEEAQRLKDELQEIETQLFGNETPTGDALAYGWGTTVPGSDDQTKLGGIEQTPKEKVN